MRWMRCYRSVPLVGVGGREGKTTQTKLLRRLLPGRPEGAREVAVNAFGREPLRVDPNSSPLLVSTDLRYPKEKLRLRGVPPKRGWAPRGIHLSAIEEHDLISPDLNGQDALLETLA